MTRMLVGSIAWALLAATALAQPQADFSGTWRRDASRSDSATYPDLAGPVTLTIAQTADGVRIERETPRGAMSDAFQFARADKTATAGVPVARWRGATLVVTLVRDIRGQSVNVEQAMTLMDGGKEMRVESTVNVQHGYTLPGARSASAGRDVYVKVAPAAGGASSPVFIRR